MFHSDVHLLLDTVRLLVLDVSLKMLEGPSRKYFV